jgi:hypothetical protein
MQIHLEQSALLRNPREKQGKSYHPEREGILPQSAREAMKVFLDEPFQ